MTQEEIDAMRKISLKDCPIEITGLPWLKETGNYRRLPKEKLPEGLPEIFYEIASSTSGAIARFRTNSKRIFFSANMIYPDDYLYHMSKVAHSGFDFYVKFPGKGLQFIHPTVPIDDVVKGFSTEVAVMYNSLYDGSGKKTEREGQTYEMWIVFPTYNTVDQAFVYVDADAEVLPPEPLKYDKPVVFYGSSITQGACASRPSLCYTNRIAIELETPITNFGFSGNARGEDWMSDIVAGLDMGVFVMDYDHNADSVQMLADTHEKFYKKVKATHPDVPVIFVTKPDYAKTLDDNDARREVIRKTYENAKARGEEVYFVDGKYFFEGMDNFCMVDNCHPNDLGFDKMTAAIEPIVKKLIER